jgi:murein DD-endopeptidase MepM/ murein hydrolase activator NlpD
MARATVLLFVLSLGCGSAPSGGSADAVLHRTLDLNVGETQDVFLTDGTPVRVKLLELQETLDEVNQAVRRAEVRVEVNGKTTTLVSGTYHLPVAFAGIQVDCPITKGYLVKARKNVWGLQKDARIRLWPANSPWVAPGSFLYPARQRWFASFTHMGNEPVYVDGGDLPAKKDIYYHYGLDIGGSEGLVDVVAATDGLVVSSGNAVLAGHEKDTPVAQRYDVVYLLDGRGWYYRYSHLKIIEAFVRPGARVKMGQKLGVLGKEGGSGGWSHLHFDITKRQPSGLWGIEEGYAFIWQTYHQDHPAEVVAVARPHSLIWTGQKALLDGSNSRGRDLRYEWTFTEGGSASGARQERVYDKPGAYCEVLKVTDGAGRVDYDFAVIQVIDRSRPDQPPPTIHAAYAPTFGIRPGDPVVFTVRTFRVKEGGETWDFGDGSAPVKVKSDGNAVQHAPAGYAETIHKYQKPGHYLVKVEHVAPDGAKAVARLHVRVAAE